MPDFYLTTGYVGHKCPTYIPMPETFAKFFSIPENTCVMLGLDPSIFLF